MVTKTIYRFLEHRSDKATEELFVRGTGIRASTIWHDRYVSRQSPDQIATDRDLRLDAVLEALSFCQENWEVVCDERDAERRHLDSLGFFDNDSTGGQ